MYTEQELGDNLDALAEHGQKWLIVQHAFDMWTVQVVMAWAGTLSSPNSHLWRGFVHSHGIHGAHLMRITFDELRAMGCPDVGTFWRHVIEWRYVVTVPAACLVSEMGIHRRDYGTGPPSMAQDWFYAQNRLARNFGLA